MIPNQFVGLGWRSRWAARHAAYIRAALAHHRAQQGGGAPVKEYAQCSTPAGCTAMEDLNGAIGGVTGMIPSGAVVQVLLRQNGYALLNVPEAVAAMNGGRGVLWTSEAGLTPAPPPAAAPGAAVQHRACIAAGGCPAFVDLVNVTTPVAMIPPNAIMELVASQNGYTFVKVDLATRAALGINQDSFWVKDTDLAIATAPVGPGTGQIRMAPLPGVDLTAPVVDVRSAPRFDPVRPPPPPVRPASFVINPGNLYENFSESEEGAWRLSPAFIVVPAGALVETFGSQQGYVLATASFGSRIGDPNSPATTFPWPGTYMLVRYPAPNGVVHTGWMRWENLRPVGESPRR